MPAHSPEEIHALIAAALNDGDRDAFIELHEEHATTIVPPDGRQVSGHDEPRRRRPDLRAAAPQRGSTSSQSSRPTGWL